MLYDDRDVSPGVKFADADLVGVPVQLVVGAKGVGRGVVERSDRATGDGTRSHSVDAVVDARLTRAGAMTLPVTPPVSSRCSRSSTRELPDRRRGCSYEPKWDGFRCIVFRDGDELELRAATRSRCCATSPSSCEPLLAQLPERSCSTASS